MRNLKRCGEKLIAENSAANKFINKFSVITKGYSEHQIFNCNEIGLYFKMLPRNTFTSVHNRPDGTKKSKRQGDNKYLCKCQQNNKATFIVNWKG